MKNNCIIEKIKGKRPVNDDHISRITGQRKKPAVPYYRNVETGDKYYTIAGGIAWPGKSLPGFVLIMAVKKNTQRPIFQLLAEKEDYSISGLLNHCIDLRLRYGYKISGDLLHYWYGDYNKFVSLLSDFNKEKFGPKYVEGIYISPAADFDKPNKFEIYVRRIQSCLAPNDSGKKNLYIGNCDKVRNHIQILPSDAAIKGSVEDYPAIAALGYLVHSLSQIAPWKTNIERETLVSTQKDDYVQLAATEQEEALRDLGIGEFDFEDMDEYDDGNLKETI